MDSDARIYAKVRDKLIRDLKVEAPAGSAPLASRWSKENAPLTTIANRTPSSTAATTFYAVDNL